MVSRGIMRAIISQLHQKARPFVTAGLNICFPPRCSACETITDAAHGLCLACFSGVEWISAPQCACCGTPFAMPMGEGTLCGYCVAQRPAYASARSAMSYDEVARALVAGFKYRDRTQHAPMLARWMQRSAFDTLSQCDLIVPVPLHWRRLFQRRYNQSWLLAQQLGNLTAKPVLADGLLRVRHTPPQASLGRTERLQNVKGAFRANHRHALALRGKVVALIDDVMTTGATIDACTHALMQAQVRAVHVITLARTLRE